MKPFPNMDTFIMDKDEIKNESKYKKEELKEHNDGGNCDKHYFDRWDYVMSEMIFAFESKLEDWEEQFMSGETDVDFKEIPDKKDSEGEPLYEMVYGPNHTREYNTEGMKKYSDRINKGFRLFGKYYNGLWD